MNITKRKMPTELAIRAHWADRLWRAKGYDSAAEFMERGTCFACGMDGAERAHILARAAGGDDRCRGGIGHLDGADLSADHDALWL